GPVFPRKARLRDALRSRLRLRDHTERRARRAPPSRAPARSPPLRLRSDLGYGAGLSAAPGPRRAPRRPRVRRRDGGRPPRVDRDRQVLQRAPRDLRIEASLPLRLRGSRRHEPRRSPPARRARRAGARVRGGGKRRAPRTPAREARSEDAGPSVKVPDDPSDAHVEVDGKTLKLTNLSKV